MDSPTRTAVLEVTGDGLTINDAEEIVAKLLLALESNRRASFFPELQQHQTREIEIRVDAQPTGAGDVESEPASAALHDVFDHERQL